MYPKILFSIKSIFVVLSFLSLLFSCNDNDKVAGEVAKVNVDFKISRFDKEFSNANPEELPRLRKKYPYLFPAPDSVWVKKMQDTIQVELSSEVEKTFADFDNVSTELEMFFKHMKYYFPKFKEPHVITVTNDVDYQNRIILADSLLFISLDNYLGHEHKFYRSIQKYLAARMDKKFITSDVANVYFNTMVSSVKDRSFLAQMIYYGKALYIKDKLMPSASDAQKIGYTSSQIDWANANEEPIWRNFIENELLYSTDNRLALRFLDPAPFSKFGLELDNESPGRIGRYVGWQIVRAFMDNNNVSINQLLNLSGEEIFKKSNYKPRR